MQPGALWARSPYALPATVAAVVAGADQVTKWLVLRSLGPGNAVPEREILGSLLSLHYVENTGVAFGFLQGQGLLVPLLAMAVVAFLLRMYRRVGSASAWIAVGSGLIFGGAIGNLIDRVRLGFVVDFIRVASWPTFNLADSAITVGVIALAWWYWHDSPRGQPRNAELAHSPAYQQRSTRQGPDR